LIFIRENTSVIILSFASTIVIALFTNKSASSVVNDLISSPEDTVNYLTLKL
jgi:hypothetical protein